jgi:hypothetical protein
MPQFGDSEILAQLEKLSGEPVKPVRKYTGAKRGRKPGVKNKPKVKAKPKAAKPKVAKVAKVEKVTKVVKVAKPKAVSPAAVPKKRGPKPKVQANAAVKTGAKRGPKPKISLETVSDDGLPTLNKVLEAYAKSTGPRGKVGEIN